MLTWSSKFILDCLWSKWENGDCNQVGQRCLRTDTRKVIYGECTQDAWKRQMKCPNGDQGRYATSSKPINLDLN